MLRITQNSQIVFRATERWVSFDLLKGLGIALVFHGIFFLIFRPIFVSVSAPTAPLPPLCVEVDLSGIIKKTASREVYLPKEHTSEPVFLDFPSQAVTVDWRFLETDLDDEPDFSEEEKLDYEILEEDD